ncbi:hypothetical protein C8D87_105148 [Lentzea atacamensis]|uniref:Uncharacterized protein n=1 Tax=Lentzea atacamensis TaxID=531938 RepID=A0ABX9E5L1_9PSEU|nr:hypothetical protein [Lentzea atacamensis]RAS64658.1 hypothetical protein C8D87_105148 [Lentzea atacamensis]
MTVWSELAKDSGGIALFVIWLVLPLVYVIALGRRYVRQAREAAQEATWANEEVQAVLEDLQDAIEPDESDQPTVPTARAEDTWELPRVERPERVGKHRLDRSEVASCLK